MHIRTNAYPSLSFWISEYHTLHLRSHQARNQEFVMGGLMRGSGAEPSSRRRPIEFWGQSPQPPKAEGLRAKPLVAEDKGI